jgi:putative membrane protein
MSPARTHRLRRPAWIGAIALTALAASAAASQTPIPPAAKDFAAAAAQSDQYEIQAGRDAVAQSQDPRVRAFAQEMIDEHLRTLARLDQAAQASGLIPPPPAMSSDQAAMLAALQGLRGADFDKAYARQQVLVHAAALAVERSYAGAGTDPNLRAAAVSTVPLVKHHLDIARSLSDALGG